MRWNCRPCMKRLAELVVYILLALTLLSFIFREEASAGDHHSYISTIVPCMMQPPYECTSWTSIHPPLLPDREACAERGNQMAEDFVSSGTWPSGIAVRITVHCWPHLPGRPFPPGLGLSEFPA